MTRLGVPPYNQPISRVHKLSLAAAVKYVPGRGVYTCPIGTVGSISVRSDVNLCINNFLRPEKGSPEEDGSVTSSVNQQVAGLA